MTIDVLESINVMIADDNPKADNTAAAFPEYPGEKPAKATLKRWVETWRNDLDANGYSALLRGETPFELHKLEDLGPRWT